jgi:hypothetical protein
MKSNFTVPVGTLENMKYFKILVAKQNHISFRWLLHEHTGVELLMILVILQHYQKTMLRLIEPGVRANGGVVEKKCILETVNGFRGNGDNYTGNVQGRDRVGDLKFH